MLNISIIESILVGLFNYIFNLKNECFDSNVLILFIFKDKTMEYYSTYKEDFLSNGVHKLAKLVVKASGNNYAYRVF